MVDAVNKVAKKKGERWWAELADDANTVLAYKPEDCTVTVDKIEGRFLCYHRKLKARRSSVSWSSRGMTAAVALTLRCVWPWEHEFCGRECPLPPEFVGVVG